MDDAHTQAALFAQMADPSFYPHPAHPLSQRETHISKVFLAGDVVYKIKKPLNLGFLDFTSLEKRAFFCRRELTLNRRLAPKVYLDVVPITLDQGRFYINGPGEVVEHAVKMRRLADDDTLARRLADNTLTPEDIQRLAALLVDFYGAALPLDEEAETRQWETVLFNCEENFTQLAPFAGGILAERPFQIIRSATLSFLHHRKPLFESRSRNHRIRDCHGDLKTGHVYFTKDGVQVIDCIEFNERFRFQDIASDLAFLAMDMDFAGRPETARALIHAYVQRSGDVEIFALLNFYKCYRAMVLCKINAMRLDEGGLNGNEAAALLAETRTYLDLAYGYALSFARPVIWVVCGLPASGKSAVAGELSSLLGAKVFHSDVVRKQLFGVAQDAHLNLAPEASIYSPKATSLTYGRLLLLAQETMEKGESVVLDATFSRAHDRREALRLARDMDVKLVFVECVAPEAVLRKRLIQRETTATVSDARIGHFDYFKARFEPLDEGLDARHIRVNTARPMGECLMQVLSGQVDGDGAA